MINENTALKIEGEKGTIKINGLKFIDGGRDGKVYRLDKDRVIKILSSYFITEAKIEDLREAVLDGDRKSSRLVVPQKIVSEENPQNAYLRFGVPIGYVSPYIESDVSYLENLTCEEFMDEICTLRDEIHKYFSKNQIAVVDSNPRNLIFSGKKVHLIDHDRDITPSSAFYQKIDIINDDYESYNDKKLALLAYKALLLQIIKSESLENEFKNVILYTYVNQEAKRDDINFTTLRKELKGYRCIPEYTKSRFKSICA